jgi:hypothetical protein
MRLIAVLGAACLAWAHASPLRAVEQKGTPLVPVSLSLRVNADGSQSDLACGPTVVAELCPVLRKGVAGWRFSPGTRDGVPAAIDVWLSLRLVAIEKPGGFAIQATHATVFGRSGDAASGGLDPNTRKLHPPLYPIEKQRRDIGALVVIEITRSPGSPTPVLGKAWLDGAPAPDGDPFVAASRAAMEKWELEPWPAELISMCVPIEFTVGKTKPLSAPYPRTAPCENRYVEGFALPKLLTDPATASF